MAEREFDPELAVMETTRQFWEWFRNIYDVYMIDVGVPGEDPTMPTWDELSDRSRDLVKAAAGSAMMAAAQVALSGAMPEVSPPS